VPDFLHCDLSVGFERVSAGCTENCNSTNRKGAEMKRGLKCAFIVGLALGVSTLTFPREVRAQNVPLVGQEMGLWCWAASAQMIGTFQHVKADLLPQCQQANHVTGYWTCCPSRPGDPRCNVGGRADWSFQWWGLPFTNKSSSLSAAQIKTEAKAQRPWVHGYTYRCGTSTCGHQVVAVTAYTVNNVLWIQMNDPSCCTFSAPYSQYLYDTTTSPPMSGAADTYQIHW
jgi:hypothetical protein